MSSDKTWSLDEEAAAEGVTPRGDASPLLVPRPVNPLEGAPPPGAPSPLKKRLATSPRPPRPPFLAAPVTSLPELAPGTTFAAQHTVVDRAPPSVVRYASACWRVEYLEKPTLRLLRLLEIAPPEAPEPATPERANAISAALLQFVKRRHEMPENGTVEVLDFGVREGHVPWLIEPLLDGEPLSEVVQARGPLGEAELKPILHQLCTILAAAHDRGFVHGGLRPEAVHLLARPAPAAPPGYESTGPIAPLVKVGDWAIGRLLAEARADAPDSMAWFSFEQCQGKAPTWRSDLHALGLIAFYALTGRHWLKVANGPPATLMEHWKEVLLGPPVPASERAGELGCEAAISPWFDGWFYRCTAPAADVQFASVAEARAALDLPPGPAPSFKRTPVIMANPKGSRYVDPPPDSGPDGEWVGGYRGGPGRDHGDVILGNPKGSFYSDRTLDAGERRWPRRLGLAMALLVVVGLVAALLLKLRIL